jgi:hypothetical protein
MRATGANGESSQYRCARGLFKSGKTVVPPNGPNLSGGGHGRPQFQRRIDQAKSRKTASGAPDCDIAVVKQTAGQGLIDIDALNLLHIHLDGGPTYKTTLQDDAPIGDSDFGRQAPKPGRDEGANGGDGGDNCEETRKIPRCRGGSRRRLETRRRKQQAEEPENRPSS